MAEPTDIAGVIQSIQDDVTTIVRGEMALVADELKAEATKAGVIAGLFGGAGYVALSAMAVLFSAFAFAWSIGFQSWFHLDVLPSLFWGFLVMGALMLVIAGLMGLIGAKVPTPGGPTKSIASAKDQVAFVKGAISEAGAEASAQPWLPGRPTPAVPELD